MQPADCTGWRGQGDTSWALGGRGRGPRQALWAIGARIAQRYILKSDFPRRVWRIHCLDHPMGPPDLASSFTSDQDHISVRDFEDRNSPEQKRGGVRSAGGACRPLEDQ